MNRFCNYIFLLIVLVFYTGKSAALILKHYTTSDKLISNTVYHTFCDSKGYMWFCTDKGLSRFDGREFKNFSGSDGLGGNEVFNMYEDKTGRLWLFTFNGEPSYYYNGKFYNSDNDDLLSKLPVLSYINAMYEDGNAIYIGYLNGTLIKITQRKIKWLRKCADGPDLLQAFVKKGDSLIAVSSETYTYLKDDRIVNVKKVMANKSFAYNDNLITSTHAGIRMLDNRENTTVYAQYDFNYFNLLNLYADGSGNLFVCARNGLTIINNTTGKVTKLLHNVAVSSIRQDSYKNYWITTLNNGVYYLSEGLLNAQKILYDPAFQLISSNNTIFIQSGNRYSYFSAKKDQPEVRHLVTLDNHSNIPSYLDSNKFIYTSFWGTQGVIVYYRHTGKHEYISKVSQPKYIFPWIKDTLIFVTGDNMYKVHFAPGGCWVMPVVISGTRILKVCFPDYDKKIYYATSKELSCFNPATNKILIIDRFKENVMIESMWSVSSLLVLCDSRKKIRVYDLKNGYRKYHAHSDYIIYSGEKINNKYLLHTDKGYVTAHIAGDYPRLIEFRALEYPLQHLDVQVLDIQGDNVLGKIDGQLLFFDKALLNKHLYAPRLYIEKADINGKRYDGKYIQLKNTTECNVKIYLSAVTVNDNTRYRYRIQRGNSWSDWYYSITPNLEILLSKAGLYRLEIYAVSDNNKVSAPVGLTLDIHPPFFYSNSFYFLSGLLIIAIVIYSVRLYVRQKKKMFQNKLKHLQLEHKAINSLLNPHFIFNVVNNIQDLINNGSKESANNYLVTMSKMIRQNIENLSFNLIPIENELELIKNYVHLQNLRFNNNIQLTISHDMENSEDIFLPPLLLHNFIENAIVHGFKKGQVDFKIDVVIRLTVNDYLSVKIIDNGIGLQTPSGEQGTKDKTSMGIDFNRQRLQRISEFYNVGFKLEIGNRADGMQGAEVNIVLYARFARLIQP